MLWMKMIVEEGYCCSQFVDGANGVALNTTKLWNEDVDEE
jgi:hypothetical protein